VFVIEWNCSEQVEGLRQMAPDVLRKLAKTFPDESDPVKHQTLLLAVKLYLDCLRQQTASRPQPLPNSSQNQSPTPTDSQSQTSVVTPSSPQTQPPSSTPTPTTNVTVNSNSSSTKDEKILNTVVLLFQYVLNLAKYDLNYDIRDRARIIRRIFFNPTDETKTLRSLATKLFITQKPTPSLTPLTDPESIGYFLSFLTCSHTHIIRQSFQLTF
jgi:vesicle coat complex subunit